VLYGVGFEEDVGGGFEMWGGLSEEFFDELQAVVGGEEGGGGFVGEGSVVEPGPG